MPGLIIGIDHFGKVIEQQLPFVDKSLFIQEVLDNANIDVSVIARPRRFGKTLNLSMLHHFLAAQVNGTQTQGMFDGLKIAQQGSAYMQHQGKYPVIFISFKEVKHSTYEKAYGNLTNLMSATYAEHYSLLTSDALHPHEKKLFEDILYERATPQALSTSLLNLTNYLYRHYQVKPWLLIDEYDTPIQAGYLNGYYSQIIELMRGLFGSALKGNVNLHRAVITGILRIAKENLFSDLNNVKVFSVLNPEYATHFGFTEAEVDTELQRNSLQHLATDIKAWYNGYHIGDHQIYNPWSIANCINEKGLLKAYWVNTSGNDLIKQNMARIDADSKKKFESVLAGGSLETRVNENITFIDLDKDANRLWSLLLFAGYLTAVKNEWVGTENKCLLKPPNQEVTWLYREIIVGWFASQLTYDGYDRLLRTLTTGNLEEFLAILEKFLFHSASYFDVSGTEPEKFYHGFVMGLIVSLADTHQVQSNQESGFGRYDVVLIPKDPTKLGIILEFKVAKSAAVLQETAGQALAQINAKGYAAQLEQQGIQQILKIGLAFYGKEVAMTSEGSGEM